MIDISNPTSPYLIKKFEQLPGNATSIANLVAMEGLTYISTFEDGIHILDFTNPLKPRQVSSYKEFGEAIDLAVTGKTGYLANGSGGLVVLSIE